MVQSGARGADVPRGSGLWFARAAPRRHSHDAFAGQSWVLPGCLSPGAPAAGPGWGGEDGRDCDRCQIRGLGAGRGGGGGFGFSEVNENVQAYGVPRHNHIAEIEQELSHLATTPVQVVFTPHLIPMTRGILATAYAPLTQDLSAEEARDLYATAY